MNWMNSDFASWEVEGQVMERVESALKDAEKWRFAKQGLKAKRSPNKYGFWKSARIAISQLVKTIGRIERLFDKELSMNQSQPADWSAIKRKQV